ncbi:MAG: glycosyltransferase family 4 protein [Endomicrobiaceae bacterium]|jgi:glycosyltransferase involved in cell wall biosynthesis|nr:glycosyltransferase family 4 protein [Endomicrobiaceae bacterium]
MKKILIISPYFPYPPRDGGKVRLYNLIKHLSKDNEVYLLAYIEPEASSDSIRTAKEVCKDVFPVVRHEDKRIEREDIPRCVSFFYTQAMIDELNRVLNLVKPDLVQLDFLIMTEYVKHIKNIPVFYTEHDLGTLDFNQSYHDRDLPDNVRYVEWRKLVEYERNIINKFKSVIVLTDRDKNIMNKFNPDAKTVVIQTGVDIDFFNIGKKSGNEKNLVFVGHYKHYPNADAIVYFVRFIFDKIIKRIPDIKLYVVGSGLTEDVRRLEKENIIITGEVEDIRQYLKCPNIFIAPVRLGGGIKGKVLEAMASGVPVVATQEAAEGIQCEHYYDILVADTASKFADMVIELCLNDKLYNKISENARMNAVNQYDWKVIAKKLNAFYEKNI